MAVYKVYKSRRGNIIINYIPPKCHADDLFASMPIEGLLDPDEEAVKKLLDECKMAPKRKKGKKLKYSLNEDVYISFDLNGYIIEAKGFGFLMWSSNIDIDKELIGKHIDELSKMLYKNCISREVYLRFETDVHVDLLKEMLQYKGAIDD